jgi:hypothetical protein
VQWLRGTVPDNIANIAHEARRAVLKCFESAERRRHCKLDVSLAALWGPQKPA